MSILIGLPDDDMLARLASEVEAKISDDVELAVWRVGDEPLDRRIDLLVIPYVTSYGFLAELDPAHVSVVQSQSLGYDGAADVVPDGVKFCNAVGVHEAPTAELALTLVLASQRGWPEIGHNQAAEKWERPAFPGLIGRHVLLIGVGGIGREVEARLSGFGAILTRVARTARDDERGPAHGPIHGIDELPELLPAADIVILAVPLSDETRGLVDDAFLTLLPAGALVVNVSRGPIVDTDALVEHVRSGHVRSALDVVDPEPLPARHPLWSLPGSLISPHLGGNVQSMKDRIDPLVLEQIGHLRAGRSPINIVIGK
jgi:phosphoglycerate dehydrogenase-like enzyme